MKYGNTLAQRSIPEWGSYNVDYNDLKHLIKVRTSRERSSTIPIPGSGDEDSSELQEFEKEFYAELVDQHERVDLFVQSKAGEVQRRLAHLQRLVDRLGRRDSTSQGSRAGVRKRQRFSKIEEEVLGAGEDIQALSRFVGAQRLAFQKLLKKYQKWTRSSKLARRFTKEVMDQPTSFCNRDLAPLLSQWTAVLAAVRAPFMKEQIKRTDTPASIPSGQTSAEDLPMIVEPVNVHSLVTEKLDTDVDFDVALALLAQYQSAKRATYWVHRDNLVQLQVLMLQFARLWHRPGCHNGGSLSATPTRRSSSTYGQEREESTGLVVLDDVDDLCQRYKSAFNAEADGEGRAFDAAVRTLRCCGDGSAAVDLKSRDEEHTGDAVKVDMKQMRSLFKHSSGALSRRESDACTLVNEPDRAQVEKTRQWLAEHPKVRPLVEVQSTRTRFIGLNNAPARSIWAVLDQEVKMGPVSSEQLAHGDARRNSSTGHYHSFPHAVLEIWWEGEAGAALARALDQSYLTERVYGFSLGMHAVSVTCGLGQSVLRNWSKELAKDIRKVPDPVERTLSRTTSSTHIDEPARKSNNISGSTTTVTDFPSGSSNFAPVMDSSATSLVDDPAHTGPGAGKKTGKGRRIPPRRENSHQKSNLSSVQRYWNEYDDPEDQNSEGSYAIYIYPNDSSSFFPGQESITNAFKYIGQGVKSLTTKTSEAARSLSKSIVPRRRGGGRSWLFPTSQSTSQPNEGAARDPLLPTNRHHRHASATGAYDSGIEAEDEDSATDIPGYETVYDSRRAYSTFPPLEDYRHQAGVTAYREKVLFRTYVAFLTVSVVILTALGILVSTTSDEFTYDLGTIMGVVMSLSLAVMSVGMMLTRRDHLSWTHRGAVLLVFAIVCVVSGVLLALVGSQL
ncbi:SPX-domain-containing protein [Xylona heveae TC161]|uniref:SPX-domain-containing protein n=1 Tax=Xylona heveae (strain CBS 132557 / TC161) TaxID=1328760 RepID=A0A165IZJ1_XYLHT|nr:SPX-domain-containing protein [Xylona heveae TC161]KZF25589.1 SPX-domain-containing protein [Xylona heveae TC161]